MFSQSHAGPSNGVGTAAHHARVQYARPSSTNGRHSPTWTQPGPAGHTYRQQQTAHPSPVSPMTTLLPLPRAHPSHVRAIHAFDPSCLASTSPHARDMYLSFSAGDIIRVHLRDESGWWDGELEGDPGAEGATEFGAMFGGRGTRMSGVGRRGPRRGWFPSNYIVEVQDGQSQEVLTAQHDQSQPSSRSVSSQSSSSTRLPADVQAGSHDRRFSSLSRSTSPAPGPSSFGQTQNPLHSHTQSTTSSASSAPSDRLSSAYQALMHPIIQSLTVLESSIHSRHISHIQPSAAAVISAIRAALQDTGCLGKESPVLLSRPDLAKERKLVLVHLSKLVASARSASGALDPLPTDWMEAEELDKLARFARAVFTAVKRFLALAEDAGVKVVTANGAAGMPMAPAAARTLVEPTESNERMQGAFKMKATSIADLRAARKRFDQDQAPPLPSASSTSGTRPLRLNLSGIRNAPADHQRAQTHDAALSGRSTPLTGTFAPNSDHRVFGSMDSAASYSTGTSSDVSQPPLSAVSVRAPTPQLVRSAPPLDSVADVRSAIETAKDGLLSIIAAFIGHIHSHHIASHASSHANLIEMTRETIDAVRDILTIVESIGRNQGIRTGRPREVEQLRMAKDKLYEAASELVEHAESVADAHAAFEDADDDDEAGQSSRVEEEEVYEADKAGLLRIATATLRSGTECVRLVKACLPDKADVHLGVAPSTPVHLTASPTSDAGIDHRQLTPRPGEAALVTRDKIVGARGLHTLSGLHRKATSLSNLQLRFQQDGSLVHAPPVEADELDSDAAQDEEEEQEVVQDIKSREDDLTLRHPAPGFPGFAVSATPPSFPVVPVRPVLLHVNTSPGRLLLTPRVGDPSSRAIVTDITPTAFPRSRSSSLSSPAPPPRIAHRSPSRSADLDKFTSDYDITITASRRFSAALEGGDVRVDLAQTAGYDDFGSSVDHRGRSGRVSVDRADNSFQAAGSIRSPTPPPMRTSSLRSSGESQQTWQVPQTPVESSSGHYSASSLANTLDPPLKIQTTLPSRFHVPSALTSVPRFGDFAADHMGHQGVRSATLPRPAPLNRTATAPMPSTQTDVRFLIVAHDYDPREITFNPDGAMVGASLAVLVEKMTRHDAPADAAVSSVFFLTFRLYTSPMALLEALISRYNLRPPQGLVLGQREQTAWMERKVMPVRLKVFNFLRLWLEQHWRAQADDEVLPAMREFATTSMAQTLPAVVPRLLDCIHWREAGPNSASSSHFGSVSSARSILMDQPLSPIDRFGPSRPPLGPAPPTPIISKSLNSQLTKGSPGKISLTEFDTLELARQLSILESRLFQHVSPEDLLSSAGKGKTGTVRELKALSELSNQITGWVADGILDETDPKKRGGLLKFYIKLADKCLGIQNFSTMFAIMAGLNSSIILRLRKTWDALSAKHKGTMERLNTVIEHTKNHAAYRARLRDADGPCLPFLGLILTDITFTAEGNPDTRPSTLSPELQLLNMDKYQKLGKIALDFQRYQRPFNFHELEPVQAWLRRTLAERGSGNLDALYRKSLKLEPRQEKEKERWEAKVERPTWLGGVRA